MLIDLLMYEELLTWAGLVQQGMIQLGAVSLTEDTFHVEI